MSLTLPTTGYDDQVKLGNIVENWIMQVGFDDFPTTATDFLPISLHPTTIGSVYYHGVVQKSPTVRDSIDLTTSTAKSGNVTLSLNNIQYKGDDLSAELFGGTRNYINRTVKIYSCMPGATALTDCLQVAQLRTVDIKHDDNTITISLVEQRPWDFISFPQFKTTIGQIYEPVSFGNFTKNTYSDYATPQYLTALTSKAYRPIPLNSTLDAEMRFVNGDQAETGSDGGIAFFDKNLDVFLPVTDADTDSTTEDGSETLGCDVTLKRGFSIKPSSSSTSQTTGDIVLANADRAYNGNDADYMSLSFDVTAGDQSDRHIELFKLEMPSGDFSQGKMFMTYRVIVTAATDTSNVDIVLSSGVGSFSNTNITSHVAKTTITGVTMTDNSGEISLDVVFAVGSPGDLDVEIRVYELYFELEELEGDDKATVMFTAGDGLPQSYNGGSGDVTTGLSAHRELLKLFSGYDVADNALFNWNTSFPSSGSLNIEASRITAPWNIRAWDLDPTLLKKYLEQIQYEFGFIFKWRAEGSGSYWFIKNSYSSGDESATLTEKDVRNLKVSNTSFSELITRMDINYKRHPAENRYISSSPSANTTARTAWNIQTEENIVEVNLDMNVDTPATDQSGDPNDDFYSYYDNIFGDIKLIVECEIVNPKYYNLETGDIVIFNYSIVDPFGYIWDTSSTGGKWFMITDLTRSIGSMKIKCREVYTTT
ncbi:hypothetical protein HN803_03540 [candidate division WWE3 bacterium]|nr:hypothetical protein [candidate division WWE3 bacterium]